MQFIGLFRNLISTLGDAVFPPVCECCGRALVDGEVLLCLHCLHDMPRTYFHRDAFSEIHKRLAAPGLPIVRTASLFHYIKESPYARLIQLAKYNNRPSINRFLARLFASELQSELFFDGIDILLPIPLHWRKQWKRGYNQSEVIAMGISDITGIKIADNLKAQPHSTQTRKNAIERAANMQGKIKVTHPEELENRHCLIIDDVITTGATILTAAKAILTAAPSASISVLTLAASKHQ